jgi:selenocysteine lyase/cysteine desulfurase
MELSRREFIAAGAALVAAAATPHSLLAAVEAHTPPLPDLSSWPAVRAQFATSADLLHFSSFYLASHPKPVRDAIDGFRRALDANPFVTVEHGMFESADDNLQLKVLADVARYLGGTPDEIALTANTTMGLGLVYHGLPLAAGDEVLATTHDHYSHHEAIRLATARSGATWRRVPLFDHPADATAEGIVGRLREAIGERTRVIGVTWVHSSTGMRLPIRAIADALGAVNRNRSEADRILLVVDGVHGIGAVDETIADLGADFFCAGTHKWIWGPRGTGIVWARPASWARLRPTFPSFSSMEQFQAWMDGTPAPQPTRAREVSPGGFWAYEHQWAMGAAFRMHERIGRARLAGRIQALNTQLKDGLAATRGVRLHTPRDPSLSAGITCFEIDGKAPDVVVKRLLERRIVASTSPYKVTYARLAPGVLNDPQQVETALREVRAIAASA